MRNLTPKEARQQLTTLTAKIFKLSIDDLIFYFKCAPLDHDYENALVHNRSKIRAARNSKQPLDKYFPISKDRLDEDGDEQLKLIQDFSFVREYLRGPNKDVIGGALADCVQIDPAYRSQIFALDNDEMWYHQIVFFICANAYGIEIKGDQLDAMGALFECITDPSLTDEAAVIKFKQTLVDYTHDLNKHWDTEDRVRHYLRIVADIISCIIFPIALMRAAESKYNRGTWNFFKPLSSALPRLSNEIVASMEHSVEDESSHLLQPPSIDEHNEYRQTTRSQVPQM